MKKTIFKKIFSVFSISLIVTVLAFCGFKFFASAAEGEWGENAGKRGDHLITFVADGGFDLFDVADLYQVSGPSTSPTETPITREGINIDRDDVLTFKLKLKAGFQASSGSGSELVLSATALAGEAFPFSASDVLAAETQDNGGNYFKWDTDIIASDCVIKISNISKTTNDNSVVYFVRSNDFPCENYFYCPSSLDGSPDSFSWNTDNNNNGQRGFSIDHPRDHSVHFFVKKTEQAYRDGIVLHGLSSKVSGIADSCYTVEINEIDTEIFAVSIYYVPTANVTPFGAISVMIYPILEKRTDSSVCVEFPDFSCFTDGEVSEVTKNGNDYTLGDQIITQRIDSPFNSLLTVPVSVKKRVLYLTNSDHYIAICHSLPSSSVSAIYTDYAYTKSSDNLSLVTVLPNVQTGENYYYVYKLPTVESATPYHKAIFAIKPQQGLENFLLDNVTGVDIFEPSDLDNPITSKSNFNYYDVMHLVAKPKEGYSFSDISDPFTVKGLPADGVGDLYDHCSIINSQPIYSEDGSVSRYNLYVSFRPFNDETFLDSGGLNPLRQYRLFSSEDLLVTYPVAFNVDNTLTVQYHDLDINSSVENLNGHVVNVASNSEIRFSVFYKDSEIVPKSLLVNKIVVDETTGTDENARVIRTQLTPDADGVYSTGSIATQNVLIQIEDPHFSTVTFNSFAGGDFIHALTVSENGTAVSSEGASYSVAPDESISFTVGVKKNSIYCYSKPTLTVTGDNDEYTLEDSNTLPPTSWDGNDTGTTDYNFTFTPPGNGNFANYFLKLNIEKNKYKVVIKHENGDILTESEQRGFSECVDFYHISGNQTVAHIKFDDATGYNFTEDLVSYANTGVDPSNPPFCDTLSGDGPHFVSLYEGESESRLRCRIPNGRQYDNGDPNCYYLQLAFEDADDVNKPLSSDSINIKLFDNYSESNNKPIFKALPQLITFTDAENLLKKAELKNHLGSVTEDGSESLDNEPIAQSGTHALTGTNYRFSLKLKEGYTDSNISIDCENSQNSEPVMNLQHVGDDGGYKVYEITGVPAGGITVTVNGISVNSYAITFAGSNNDDVGNFDLYKWYEDNDSNTLGKKGELVNSTDDTYFRINHGFEDTTDPGATLKFLVSPVGERWNVAGLNLSVGVANACVIEKTFVNVDVDDANIITENAGPDDYGRYTGYVLFTVTKAKQSFTLTFNGNRYFSYYPILKHYKYTDDGEPIKDTSEPPQRETAGKDEGAWSFGDETTGHKGVARIYKETGSNYLTSDGEKVGLSLSSNNDLTFYVKLEDAYSKSFTASHPPANGSQWDVGCNINGNAAVLRVTYSSSISIAQQFDSDPVVLRDVYKFSLPFGTTDNGGVATTSWFNGYGNDPEIIIDNIKLNKYHLVFSTSNQGWSPDERVSVHRCDSEGNNVSAPLNCERNFDGSGWHSSEYYGMLTHGKSAYFLVKPKEGYTLANTGFEYAAGNDCTVTQKFKNSSDMLSDDSPFGKPTEECIMIVGIGADFNASGNTDVIFPTSNVTVKLNAVELRKYSVKFRDENTLPISDKRALITNQLGSFDNEDSVKYNNDGVFEITSSDTNFFKVILNKGYSDSELTVSYKYENDPPNVSPTPVNAEPPVTGDDPMYKIRYEMDETSPTGYRPGNVIVTIAGIKLNHYDVNFTANGDDALYRSTLNYKIYQPKSVGFDEFEQTGVSITDSTSSARSELIPYDHDFAFSLTAEEGYIWTQDSINVSGGESHTKEISNEYRTITVIISNVKDNVFITVSNPEYSKRIMSFVGFDELKDKIKIYKGSSEMVPSPNSSGPQPVFKRDTPAEDVSGGCEAVINNPFLFEVDLGEACSRSKTNLTVTKTNNIALDAPEGGTQTVGIAQMSGRNIKGTNENCVVYEINPVSEHAIILINGIQLNEYTATFKMPEEGGVTFQTKGDEPQEITGDLTFKHGSNFEFTVQLGERYDVEDADKKIAIKNGDRTVSFSITNRDAASRTFDVLVSDVSQDMEIEVNPDINSIPITFSPAEGVKYYKMNGENPGDVLAGIQTVAYGESYNFAVKADVGYDLTSLNVSVTGGGVLSGGDIVDDFRVYTLNEVKSSVTVSASIERSTFTVTLPRNPSGDDASAVLEYSHDGVTYTSDISGVPYGTSVSFAIRLEDKNSQSIPVVKAGGNTLNLVNGEYTITNITDNMTVEVSGIVINKYTVNFVANEGITYLVGNNFYSSGTETVEYGQSFDFQVEPNTGYSLQNLVINRKSVSENQSMDPDSLGTYTISGIKENQTISVENVENIVYSITLKPIDGVTYLNDRGVTISDTLNVKYGENFEFSVSVDDAYDESIPGMYIIVNEGQSSTMGAQKLESGRYIIADITGDVRIGVGNIRKNTYVVTLTKTEGIDYYSSGNKVITGDNNVEHQGNLDFKVNLYPAYSDSVIKVMLGDNEISANSDGYYSIPSVTESKTVTVLGVQQNKEIEVVTRINQLPEDVTSWADVDAVVEVTRLYNQLPRDKQSKVTNLDVLERLQEQVKSFHHVSNDITVEGIGWSIKLVTVPLSTDTEACARIYKKLGSEFILSLYDVYLWDSVNNVRYTLPEGRTALITLPSPDLTYFEKPTGIHEKADGKVDYLTLTFRGDYTTFETGSFSPMGIIANRASTPGRSSLLDAADANLNVIREFSLANFAVGGSSGSSGSDSSAALPEDGSSSEDPSSIFDSSGGNISERFKSRNNKITAQGSALRLVLVLLILILIAVFVFLIISALKRKKDEDKK